MASSVSAFVCTIPAGTSPTSPHAVALDVGPNPLASIHWRVPPGPRGHLGWWLTQSGVQVLPDTYGTALVADDEADTWTLDTFPESGTWACVGWNTGTYDHTVYLEFAYQAAQATLTGTDLGDYPPNWPLSDADIPTAWQAV
jgi:hypothetical protein